MSKTITIADGVNITANSEGRKEDWKYNLMARGKMITQTKSDICESILATITRDIMQLVEFKVNEETTEVSGRLSIELSDEIYSKYKWTDYI